MSVYLSMGTVTSLKPSVNFNFYSVVDIFESTLFHFLDEVFTEAVVQLCQSNIAKLHHIFIMSSIVNNNSFSASIVIMSKYIIPDCQTFLVTK